MKMTHPPLVVVPSNIHCTDVPGLLKLANHAAKPSSVPVGAEERLTKGRHAHLKSNRQQSKPTAMGSTSLGSAHGRAVGFGEIKFCACACV